MIAVDVACCVDALQAALVEKKQRIRELVPGKAWYLGVVQTGAIDCNVILVPGDLDAAKLALLGDQVAKLPRCTLDVALTGGSGSFSEISFARPLNTLPLSDISELEQDRITIRSAILRRWLQSFMEGRAKTAARAGRPATKAYWLHENWRHYEQELRRLPTDADRHRLLSVRYRTETGGQSLSRNTVVQVLDQVMPERVRNCH